MTPDEAADLATRTLAVIDSLDYSRLRADIDAADRERVASDLAGLRDVERQREGWRRRGVFTPPGVESHAARYADGLRRTAALYGVTES